MKTFPKILVAFILIFSFAGTCSKDDEPSLSDVPIVGSSIVNFKVDGVDYQGVIGGQTNSNNSNCPSKKGSVFSTTDVARIVTMQNIVFGNATFTDITSSNSCEFFVSLVLKTGPNTQEVFFSKSGNWTFNNNQFTFDVIVENPFNNFRHIVTASGTLK
jgi:hypothetical protein